MKKRMVKLFIAVALSSGTMGVSLQAIHVGYGVDWTYGQGPNGQVWSQTVNTQGKVGEVRASVYKGKRYQDSGWRPSEAFATLFGGGSAKAYYDYR